MDLLPYVLGSLICTYSLFICGVFPFVVPSYNERLGAGGVYNDIDMVRSWVLSLSGMGSSEGSDGGPEWNGSTSFSKSYWKAKLVL